MTSFAAIGRHSVATDATNAITDEDRPVLVATRAPERLREWLEAGENEVYAKCLWWSKTRERCNGTLPELRAWLNAKGVTSPDCKALLRTLAGCAERSAHYGRVVDFFVQHPFVNNSAGKHWPYTKWLVAMKEHGLVKEGPPRFFEDAYLYPDDRDLFKGTSLQRWATREYDRLKTLPGLQGEDEFAHNLRAALAWEVVSTAAIQLDDAVSDFISCAEGDASLDVSPSPHTAWRHGQRAIAILYLIAIMCNMSPDIENQPPSYVIAHRLTRFLEFMLEKSHGPRSIDWNDPNAREAMRKKQEEEFGEWVKRNPDPKIYKKHLYYHTLREYIAGYHASDRLRQTVFSHWEAARWIPDSKRFKAAGEEWSQLATAAQ